MEFVLICVVFSSVWVIMKLLTKDPATFGVDKLDMNEYMLLYEGMKCIVDETEIAYRQKIRNIYQHIHTKELVMVNRYHLLDEEFQWRAKETIYPFEIREFPKNVKSFVCYDLYRIPPNIKLVVKKNS